jgi:hypothetical protein
MRVLVDLENDVEERNVVRKYFYNANEGPSYIDFCSTLFMGSFKRQAEIS